MRCEEVQQQLRGFSTGELPMDVRQTVQAHLSECAACCAELAKVDALAGFLTGAQAAHGGGAALLRGSAPG